MSGEIYLSIHPILNKKVIIKFIDPCKFKFYQNRKALLKEAKILANIKHKNII